MNNYYSDMEKTWENNYPSTDTLADVEKFYSSVGYDKTPQELIDILMSNVPIESFGKIIEFGCDNGIMLNYFKKYTTELYGVDINQVSLDKGKALFPSFNLVKNTGLTIPFDFSFDVVFVSAVLKHIRPEDRPTLYSEFRKKGKYLIVFEQNSPNQTTTKEQGFTFYQANFEKELREELKEIHSFKIKDELFGVYDLNTLS